MRKSLIPGSNERDRSRIPIDCDSWSSGVIRDPPAASIPQKTSLSDAFNAIAYPKEIIPRTGSRLWTSSEIPPLAGRTGYTASKSGVIITCPSGPFTRDDTYNYWVWPGATEREHDRIVKWLSATQVEVEASGTKGTTVGCYLRGRKTLWKWHDALKLWLAMYANELWITNVDMDSWTSVVNITPQDPPNAALTACRVSDDTSWIMFNSAGIFKIDYSEAIPYVYKLNIPIPATRITEHDQTDDTPYQYGYLYGYARLAGNDAIHDRLTPSKLLTETGANNVGTDKKDYSDVWTEEPIGPSADTYGKLTCGILTGAHLTPNGYIESKYSFNVTISGDGPYEIVLNDLDKADTMPAIAAIIETALKDVFPFATCEWNTGCRFVFTTGRTVGATISYLTAGSGDISLTDFAALIKGTLATGAATSTPPIDTPNVVHTLYAPVDEDGDPYNHMTHLPIYRTLEKNGYYRYGQSDQRLNDPERFVWVKDVRICAAFYCSLTGGYIYAHVGEFEKADEGATVHLDNGTTVTIVSFVTSTKVSFYSGAPILYNSVAGAIGGGKVMRASQTGHLVTRTVGDTFTASEVGKYLTWSIGYHSLVEEYVDANSVLVYDDLDKDIQALTFDPVSRIFTDDVSDDTLRSRLTVLLCKSRLLEPMSNCNCGDIGPGFIVTAKRNYSEIEYCQIPDGYEYLAGFHNKGYQISKSIKHPIQEILFDKGTFVVFCACKTWLVPTNALDFVQIVDTGVIVAVLGGIDKIEGDIGCFDWGSIHPIQNGIFRMLTSEPGAVGYRDYKDGSFGPNLLEVPRTGQTNFADDFKALYQATASVYDAFLGHIIWGKEKA